MSTFFNNNVDLNFFTNFGFLCKVKIEIIKMYRERYMVPYITNWPLQSCKQSDRRRINRLQSIDPPTFKNGVVPASWQPCRLMVSHYLFYLRHSIIPGPSIIAEKLHYINLFPNLGDHFHLKSRTDWIIYYGFSLCETWYFLKGTIYYKGMRLRTYM